MLISPSPLPTYHHNKPLHTHASIQSHSTPLLQKAKAKVSQLFTSALRSRRPPHHTTDLESTRNHIALTSGSTQSVHPVSASPPLPLHPGTGTVTCGCQMIRRRIRTSGKTHDCSTVKDLDCEGWEKLRADWRMRLGGDCSWRVSECIGLVEIARFCILDFERSDRAVLRRTAGESRGLRAWTT